MEPPEDRSTLTRVLGPVVFALLLLATVGAFAYAQRLKREPLILDKVTFGRAFVSADGRVKRVTAFSPNGDCRADNVRIRFRVTRSDHANVQVVGTGGELIRTLARNQFLKRYRFSTFRWGGRTKDGGAAPPGRYKLRVTLLGQERTLTPGGTLRLHLVAPVPGGCERPGKGAAG